MKKTILIILGILLVAGLSGGGVWYWQKSVFDKERANFSAQVTDLRNQTTALEKSINNSPNEVSGDTIETARTKARDAKRKADLRELVNALELFYADNGNYPIVSGYAQLMTSSFKDYITVGLNDPLYPNQKYRYGISTDTSIRGLYYRLDAQLEVKTDTSAQNDMGIDPNRLEMGSALGTNANYVTCMDNCIK